MGPCKRILLTLFLLSTSTDWTNVERSRLPTSGWVVPRLTSVARPRLYPANLVQYPIFLNGTTTDHQLDKLPEKTLKSSSNPVLSTQTHSEEVITFWFSVIPTHPKACPFLPTAGLLPLPSSTKISNQNPGSEWNKNTPFSKKTERHLLDGRQVLPTLVLKDPITAVWELKTLSVERLPRHTTDAACMLVISAEPMLK